MKTRKRSKKGFSLLELLIVVAIILIIATIAVPSLLRSRQATNESAAVGDLRALNSGETTYASSNGQNFATLAQLASGGLVDSRFSAGAGSVTLHGEKYVADGATITDPTTSQAVGGAQPGSYGIQTNVSGTAARYDYETGVDAVVRYNTKFPSGSQSAAPVGQ
ncbi:MAG: prepilin-type N-terminal cleavage/methylation domain-containing protein [Acidobacteriia bacterium]|nr:prepilin-type N-terminal cleavage/methylation domain-containing protein [Terriglobia bacterium]